MPELTVKSKFFAMEDKVEVNDSEVNPIIESAIQADKDIISQIKMEYNEDNDITFVNFPKNIMPLNITFNNKTLYLLEGYLVDYNGNVVEGYALDDYAINDDNLYFAIVGNISD